MTRFNTQTEALHYLGAATERYGRTLTLDEYMDTSELSVDGNAIIAGVAYDQTQDLLLDTTDFEIDTNVLLGRFACRILCTYPEATEYLHPSFNLEPHEPGAVITLGKLEYQWPNEATFARRVVMHSFRDGAAQFLDSHFEISPLTSHIEAVVDGRKLLGCLASRQQYYQDPILKDTEIALLYCAVSAYPQLEILNVDGLRGTMLPSLAEWIAKRWEV